MKAVVVPVTPFQQNCSLLWDEETMQGALVDPGGDVDRLLAVVEENGVTLEKILLTHGHLDHAGAAAEIAERFSLPVEGPHKEDLFLLNSLAEQGARFGFEGARSCTPDRWLEGGETVTVGSQTLDVRHCPGHTPGHIVFFHGPSKLALVGDVLFQGSVGRSDLPGGNHEQLITSIRTQLWPLGDETTFVPGHGPLSKFGTERKMNPFCADFVEI
jgi:glyoxylase-like metal-dependent hydrolase (beta-lactamase superfamily II)